MSVGFTEMMVIVLFVVVVFGAKRIPELARSLGRAQYEFKKAKEAAEQGKNEILSDSMPVQAHEGSGVQGTK